MRRPLVAAAAGLLFLAACGSEDNGGVVDVGSPTSAANVDASVVVHVDPGNGGAARDATVRCQGGTASGTGFLLDQTKSAAACKLLLTDDHAKKRLVEGPPEGMSCTQIYGGPEVATVDGTLGAKPFKATIKRTDGCGIADWDLLTPLLGPPES